MLIFAILLIVVGVFVAIFGILQNTILFNIFADLNARLERANLETDFELAWVFSGPGTFVLIIGLLAAATGIALIIIRRRNNRQQRQVNTKVKKAKK